MIVRAALRTLSCTLTETSPASTGPEYTPWALQIIIIPISTDGRREGPEDGAAPDLVLGRAQSSGFTEYPLPEYATMDGGITEYGLPNPHNSLRGNKVGRFSP